MIGTVIVVGGVVIASHHIEKYLIQNGHLLVSKLVDRGVKGSIILLGGLAVAKAVVLFL
jgi:hypothetical protein